jgi:rod shape-determining protein MreB
MSNFFSKLSSYFSRDMAIDLGTANTLIYTKEDGVVLNEPSIVAAEIQGETLTPYAFGNEAKMMVGKTPAKIQAIRPLKDGVIADFKITEAMIRHFIKTINKSNWFFKPKIIICVPSTSTSVERRAIQDAAEGAGAKVAFLIEEPMAAAIGAGLPVHEATGSMIVDIGGGTTEVAIISLGGVVYGYSLRIGGDRIDEAIVQYVRKEYNVLIGEMTAEKVKKTIGTAKVEGLSKEREMIVKGRDLVNGIPKQIILTEVEIAEALQDNVQKMIDSIRTALEHSPPELASDIIERGITLTGGGSLLRNLDKAISIYTGIKVNVADEPLYCVVKGTGFVLNNIQQYKHLIFRQE